MQEAIILILKIVGSLGLFLFGMKVMSENIQKVAGNKLRQILGTMTRNRFMGVLTGFVITAIIQSSSATTVMVVSFVNAGLLNLIEAVGVIMGANIGTTATAWLVTMGLGKLSLGSAAVYFIAFGFPMLFFKREKLKFLGETIIGFAILFIGLDFLKDLAPAADSVEGLTSFVEGLTEYGFFSTIIFVLIGTLLTIILQSSSAAMTVTLIMVSQGLIDFNSAAAIVLGENIGTTITANLAAIMGNVHAKRAAIAHTIFNVTGVIWMVMVFKLFLSAVDAGLQSAGYASVYSEGVDKSALLIGLSAFHTAFNIVNTIIQVWFAKYIALVATKIIPSRGDDEQFQLEYIGSGIMQTPELSVLESKKEIVQYANLVKKMYKFIPELVNETDQKKYTKVYDRVTKYEDIVDRIEIEIAEFLVSISRNDISSSTSNEIRKMLRINSNLEKIGDLAYNLAVTTERKRNDKAWFNPQQRENLNHMFGLVNEAFDIMQDNLSLEKSKVDIDKAVEIEKKINQYRDHLRDTHFESIEKGDYNVRSGLYYNNIYNSLEKIGDLILNVNEAAAGKNVE